MVSPELCATELQWGHGDGAVEETIHLPDWTQLSQTLQWGHGDGAVEEKLMLERAAGDGEASMGPRRWSRGRVPGNAAALSALGIGLQWGHGDGAVEESLAVVLRRSPVPASMGPRRWSRGREDTVRR